MKLISENVEACNFSFFFTHRWRWACLIRCWPAPCGPWWPLWCPSINLGQRTACEQLVLLLSLISTPFEIPRMKWSEIQRGRDARIFLFKGDAHAWSAWPMPWHLNLMPLILCVVSMQAVQNLGMAVVTMLAGQIVDGQGYLVLEVFFLGWLCRESLFTTRNQLRMFSNSKITLYELQWLWWQLFWFGWWTPVKEVCSTCQSPSVTNTSGSKCKFLKWCQMSHFFLKNIFW